MKLNKILPSIAASVLALVAYGDFTYINGNNGYNGTAQRVGNFTYYNDSNGNRVTAQKVGNFTYYNDNNGNHSTAQQVGNFTYVNGSDGYNGTAQKVGNFTYYRDNQGNNVTAQRVGNFTYVNGNNSNATVQRFGNNTQINIQNNPGYQRKFSFDDDDQAPQQVVVPVQRNSQSQRSYTPTQQKRTRQTSQSNNDVAIGTSPVLNTTVSSIFLTRKEIELASGDKIKFLPDSLPKVRGWRNNDSILVYEVKSNGSVIGYQLYNANRKSFAVGTLTD